MQLSSVRTLFANHSGRRVFMAVASALLLSLALVALCGAGPAMAASFVDVGPSDWFQAAVGELSDAGVINGFSDRTFRPYNTVTRAQFSAMLARALQVPAGSAEPFADVYSSDWFYGAVSGLYSLGLVSGTSPSTFTPQGGMERQQAASLIIRSVGYRLGEQPVEGVTLKLTPEETQAWLGTFRDRWFVADVHQSAVANAVRLSIINGYADQRFYPVVTLTRAQAAGIIYQGLFLPLAMKSEPPASVPPDASYPVQKVGSSGPLVSMLESRLAALGYQCGVVDGSYDEKTKDAVMAFQKVEGLLRDGSAGAQVWSRIGAARRPAPRVSRNGTRVEIDLARQVLLYIENNTVTRIYPVSTGTTGWLTPPGAFWIDRKIPAWRESTLGLLYKPAYFNAGIAIHGAYSVPAYAASHGCVRVAIWTMDVLYPLLPVGMRVDVY